MACLAISFAWLSPHMQSLTVPFMVMVAPDANETLHRDNAIDQLALHQTFHDDFSLLLPLSLAFVFDLPDSLAHVC
jgi:hypothetical protein